VRRAGISALPNPSSFILFILSASAASKQQDRMNRMNRRERQGNGILSGPGARRGGLERSPPPISSGPGVRSRRLAMSPSASSAPSAVHAVQVVPRRGTLSPPTHSSAAPRLRVNLSVSVRREDPSSRRELSAFLHVDPR